MVGVLIAAFVLGGAAYFLFLNQRARRAELRIDLLIQAAEQRGKTEVVEALKNIRRLIREDYALYGRALVEELAFQVAKEEIGNKIERAGGDGEMLIGLTEQDLRETAEEIVRRIRSDDEPGDEMVAPDFDEAVLRSLKEIRCGLIKAWLGVLQKQGQEHGVTVPERFILASDDELMRIDPSELFELKYGIVKTILAQDQNDDTQ